MAILKAIYEKLEDIPDEYRKLYTERADKWELTEVEGTKTEADVARVQTATTAARKERDEAQAKLKLFKDIDPEGLQDKLDEHAKLLITGGKVDDAKMQELVEKQVALDRTKFERDLSEKQTELDAAIEKNTTYETKQRNTSILDELRKAATGANITSTAIADVERCANLFDVSEGGEVLTKDGNGVTPGLTADKWLADQVKASPHWVETSEGGGAKGGQGGGGSNGEEGSMLACVEDASTA